MTLKLGSARIAVITCPAVLLVVWIGIATTDALAQTEYRSVVVVGDTQSLVFEVDADGNPIDNRSVLAGIVDWILAHRDSENIDFVLHVGDIVERGVHADLVRPDQFVDRCLGEVPAIPTHNDCRVNPLATPPNDRCTAPIIDGCWKFSDFNCRSCAATRAEIDAQWRIFREEWSRLDGVVPYAIVRGNHDNRARISDFQPRGYGDYYSASFFESLEPAFAGGPRGFELVATCPEEDVDGQPPFAQCGVPARETAHAWKFRLGPHEALVIGMSDSPQSGELNWVQAVMNDPALAALPVILLSHRGLQSPHTTPGLPWVNASGQPPRDDDVRIWTTFVEDSGTPLQPLDTTPRIFMAVQGHLGSTFKNVVNLGGWETIQVMFDRQTSVGVDEIPGLPEVADEIGVVRFYFNSGGPDEVEAATIATADPGVQPSIVGEANGTIERRPFSIFNDKDKDGFPNGEDLCPLVAGDDQSKDDDGDGVGNVCDSCTPANTPIVPIEPRNFGQPNADGDAAGDVCDFCISNPDLATLADDDVDGDCVAGSVDNCVDGYNPDQRDSDGNGIGDSCQKPDMDGDGVLDVVDNCPLVSNPSQEAVCTCGDADGNGDAENADVDYVFVTCGGVDLNSCLNIDRMDLDLDGDVDGDDILALNASLFSGSEDDLRCPGRMEDADGDGAPDSDDNCPIYANQSQADFDGDGIGDSCQCGDTNGDGLIYNGDAFALQQQLFGNITLDNSIADTDNNQTASNNDILAVLLTVQHKILPRDLKCARRFPPPAP